jgi:hypothetical protein
MIDTAFAEISANTFGFGANGVAQIDNASKLRFTPM